MPEINRIWNISGEQLKELKRTSPKTEKDLEDWIERDISVISPKLLLIGRQVTTDFGGAIDLLAADRAGDLVVIELKKDRTPRDVVAQILEYASWVSGLTSEKIREITEMYLKRDLDGVFKEKFGIEAPELNRNHKMLIVAIEIDDSTERIVRYLSETYGVNINVANFEFFEDDSKNQFLLRTFMLDPSEVERTSFEGGKRVSRPKINKEEFLSACNENERKLFERLFEMAENLKLKFGWGATGCSIRVPTRDLEVFLCWCYTPLAAFGPVLYTYFKDIKSKVETLDIEEIKGKFIDANLFTNAGGTELKFDFSRELSDDEIDRIVSLFESLAKEIAERADLYE